MEKKRFSPGFAAALTWFGMYCGAGFATGREIVTYCTRHGIKGMWIPLLSWIVLGILFYIVYRYASLTQSKHYKEFVDHFYYPYGKIAALIWDVVIVFTAMIALGAFMATGASMLQTLFGGAYWIWVVLFTIVSILLGIYGMNFVTKVGTIITVPLITLLLITVVLGITNNSQHLADVFSGAVANVSDTGWGDMLYDVYNTVGVQVSFMASAIVIGGQFTTKKEIRTASIGGAIICCLMMYCGALLIFSYYPEINEETLPILKIAQGHPLSGILTIIYPIAVLLAVMSSINPVAAGITNRFRNLGSNIIKDEKTRNIILNCVIIILAALISSLGLASIVDKGFKISASLRLPLIGLPVMLLGGFKIRRLTEGKETEK